MTAKEIFDKRAKVATQMETFLAERRSAIDANDVTLADEKLRSFEAADKEFSALTDEYNRYKRAEDALTQSRSGQPGAAKHINPENPEIAEVEDEHQRMLGVLRSDQYLRATRNWVRGRASHQDVQLLTSHKRSDVAQLTTVDAQGGYTVPEEWANKLEVTKKAFGRIFDIAYQFNTSSGYPLHMPILDDTANEATARSAEMASESRNHVPFANVDFGSKTYGSGYVDVPYELLQDSAFQIDNYLLQALGIRLARKIAKDAVTGSGTSGNPTGIVTAIGSGQNVAAGAVGAATFQDILKLINKLDDAYDVGATLAFNKATLLALQLQVIGASDARPLWQPSFREGTPDMIAGKPYVILHNMADIGASNVSMIYGNFQYFYLRRIGSPMLFRSTEAGLETFSQRFVAYERFHSNLIQPNAFVKLTHPAS